MIATEITMPVTPFKATSEEQIKRLEELGAPQEIIDNARYQELSRTELVRESLHYVEWLQWAHKLDGEEERMYFKGRSNSRRSTLVALQDLKARGVISDFQSVAFSIRSY